MDVLLKMTARWQLVLAVFLLSLLCPGCASLEGLAKDEAPSNNAAPASALDKDILRPGDEVAIDSQYCSSWLSRRIRRTREPHEDA